jgi:hypothetical protein
MFSPSLKPAAQVLLTTFAYFALTALALAAEEAHYLYFSEEQGDYARIPADDFESLPYDEEAFAGTYAGTGPLWDASVLRTIVLSVGEDGELSGSITDDPGAEVNFTGGQIVDLAEDGCYFSFSVLSGWFATTLLEGEAVNGVVINEVFYRKLD